MASQWCRYVPGSHLRPHVQGGATIEPFIDGEEVEQLGEERQWHAKAGDALLWYPPHPTPSYAPTPLVRTRSRPCRALRRDNRIVHGRGPNTSASPRYSFSFFHCRSWVKPLQDFTRSIPPALVAE